MNFPNGAYPLFPRGLRCAVLLFFGLLLTACSTKKDRFLNREWHALNTKYNVLFNGEMAFEQAWEALQNGYQENFWEPLPIERFAPPLTAQATSPFDLAEQKAAKAIAKHGMTIKGEEKNDQMVAAYALLGRARYYDQRFVPALEAFNYIIRRYPASNRLNEVRVWKEKTNLRLGNEAIALENINRLLKFRKLKGQVLADAYATRAQAHINLQQIDTASWDLKKAQAFSKKPLKKARYAYLLGQLYQAQQKEDSALWAYEKVEALNRRIPLIFLVQSKLQRLFLNAKKGNTDKEAIGALSKMEDNWEYRRFLDRIYFEKSQLLRARSKDSLAIVYAQKSLKENREDRRRNAANYRLIAEVYFNQDRFETAGFYYDSLSQNLAESSIDYFRTRKKLSGIEDLVYYENQIKVSDSLLKLSAMSAVQQESYVQDLIDSEKRQDSLMRSKMAAPPESVTQEKGALMGGGSEQKIPQKTSNFYFYNPSSVARGQSLFEQQWGPRALADNWRWIMTPLRQGNPQETKGAPPPNDSKPNRATASEGILEAPTPSLRDAAAWTSLKATYLEGIPKTKEAIARLDSIWETAHYQSGKRFSEFFRRPDLAAQRWGVLLDKPASKAVLLRTLYGLYQLYLTEGNMNSERFKSRILREFPDSDYAQVLRDPKRSDQKEAAFNARYQALVAAYESQDYSAVLQQTNQWLSELLEAPKGAPIAMIQANTIGRLYGLQAYKSALKKLLLTYPKTVVSERAQNDLDHFEADPPNARYNQLPALDRHYVAILHEQPHDSIAWAQYSQDFEAAFPALQISREVFAPGKTFYVVTQLKDKAAAKALSNTLFFKEHRLKNQEIFVVLGSQYKILQLYKNMADYRKYLMESLDTDQ